MPWNAMVGITRSKVFLVFLFTVILFVLFADMIRCVKFLVSPALPQSEAQTWIPCSSTIG